MGGFGGCLWGLGGFLGVVGCVLGLVLLLWCVWVGFTRLNDRYFEILYILNLRISQKNQEISLKNQELMLKAQEQSTKAQQQTLETRQAQMFMNIYDKTSSKEFQMAWQRVARAKTGG